jgi:PAS domain S-box-containing protein
LTEARRLVEIVRMDPVPAPSRGTPRETGSPARRRWLSSEEGWIPSEDATRLLAAIAIAVAAVALKVLIIGVLDGELGYLSYLGAVAVGAWIAGARGGAAATLICAVGQTLLFGTAESRTLTPSAVLGLALFLIDGAIVTVLSSRLRRAYVRERSARTIAKADLQAEAALLDVSERDRATLSALQAVTASLAGAQTPVEVASAILDRGLAALGAAAGGVSRIADDGESVEVIAVRGYADTQAGSTVALDHASHLRDALRTGQPVFLSDLESWAARYPDSPPRSIPGESDGGAIAVLPMVAGTRTLGAIVFRFASDRAFDAPERELAVRLAEHGAQAFDRSLAWDADRRSRLALERGQARLRLLVQASDALAAEHDVLAGIAALPDLIVPAHADWCAIELLDVDAPGLTVGGPPDAAAAIERLAGAAPRSLGTWLVPASADDPAILVAEHDGWAGVLGDADAATTLNGLGTRSLLAARVATATGEPLGSIVFGATDPDRFGPDDQALIQDLAGRVAAAAERSSLFGAVTRFKATVDVAADAVYMFDPGSLRLTYVNRGGADLLGSRPDALVGTSVLELQPAVSERVFRARLADLREAPAAMMAYSEVLARADGLEFPAEVFLQEVTLADGARTVVLTARDITERIDVQARLARIAGDERRQAAELRTVIQSMGEGVLVVDPEGVISIANDAAGVILGADPAAGLATLEALAADRADGDEGAVPDETPDGRPASRTVQLEDGRWIEVSTYLADLGGAPGSGSRASRIVVLRDVTLARDAEAAREAFLGVLSHELRTPVTTIYGFAKVLQRPSTHEDPGEMLRDIEAEADRLYRIVEDLLALSRVEAGISIDGEPVLVQHLVAPVVVSESERFGQVTFETELPPNLPAVFGERTYVEQVLRNLISNAGKYGTPGTAVTIEAEETEDEVVVRVLDRGVGVPPEEADRLFELFYRSPQSARTASGAGIGLYVSRGLIRAMGGRIWVRPRPGGGSEFGFTLPRYQEDPIPALVDAPAALR